MAGVSCPPKPLDDVKTKAIIINPFKRLLDSHKDLTREQVTEIFEQRMYYFEKRGKIGTSNTHLSRRQCVDLRIDALRQGQKKAETAKPEECIGDRTRATTEPPTPVKLSSVDRITEEPVTPLASTEPKPPHQDSEQNLEIWQDLVVETHEDDPLSTLVWQRGIPPVAVPTNLLRSFSDLVAAEPTDIEVFNIDLNRLVEGTNNLVREFLYGTLIGIDGLNFVKKVDLGIAAEHLKIRGLSFLVLRSLHGDVISGYICPDRDMMIHVCGHCSDGSALKGLMVAALYLWLVIFDIDESAWRKHQDLQSWEYEDGMWLAALLDKVEQSTDHRIVSAVNGVPPASKLDTTNRLEGLGEWVASVRSLRGFSAIQDNPFFEFCNFATLLTTTSTSMYGILCRLSGCESAMLLPFPRRATAVTTPSRPQVKLDLKRKSEDNVENRPVPFKARRAEKGGLDSTTAVAAPLLDAFGHPDELKPFSPIAKKPSLPLSSDNIVVECRSDDPGRQTLDRMLACSYSRYIARKLKAQPALMVLSLRGVSFAHMSRLVSCMRGNRAIIRGWNAADILTTACVAERLEARTIANGFLAEIQYMWMEKRMSFQVANLVYQHTRKDSKLRLFVAQGLHWVLLKNELASEEAMDKECKRHSACSALHEDLKEAEETFGGDKQGNHPARLRGWELGESCRAATGVAVAREDSKGGREKEKAEKMELCGCLKEMLGIELVGKKP